MIENLHKKIWKNYSLMHFIILELYHIEVVRTERRIGMFTLMIYAIISTFMKFSLPDISNETKVICWAIFIASDLNILLTSLIKIFELKGENK